LFDISVLAFAYEETICGVRMMFIVIALKHPVKCVTSEIYNMFFIATHRAWELVGVSHSLYEMMGSSRSR